MASAATLRAESVLVVRGLVVTALSLVPAGRRGRSRALVGMTTITAVMDETSRLLY
jgi:hypothetical protein